jgi:hypothetical protein
MFLQLLKPRKKKIIQTSNPILFYVDFLTCIPFKKFEIQTESCESMLWKSRPHAEEKQKCSAIFYFGKWGLSTMFGGASTFFSFKWPPHVEMKSLQRSFVG